MKTGEGEASYARNSTTQNAGQNRMKHLIQEAVRSLWKNTNTRKSVVITDLGCSAGPNALTLVKTAVDAIFHHCSDHKEMVPEISVLLNDLPDNDFNDVAKRLHAFQQSTQDCGPVVAAIVPGSFYKKLFTSSSVNLVLSSHSLNWLSQVPEDLKKSRIPVSDKDEGLRKARRPFIVQAFSQQFRKDFTIFLNTRAKELAPNGQMVLSMVGRPSSDTAYQSVQPWDFLFVPLNDMASRGVISRDILDSFYVPLYGPSDKELMEIIQDEGSFKINNIEVHEQMTGIDKSMQTPKIRALAARAAFEPTISQHFGRSEGVMDEFVGTIERQLSHVPASPAGSLLFLCVSLTKRV